MTKLDDIDVILKRMVALLRIGAFDDWAIELENIRTGFDGDPKSISSKLLFLYVGGEVT